MRKILALYAAEKRVAQSSGSLAARPGRSTPQRFGYQWVSGDKVKRWDWLNYDHPAIALHSRSGAGR